jgi:hypothetical protein
MYQSIPLLTLVSSRESIPFTVVPNTFLSECQILCVLIVHRNMYIDNTNLMRLSYQIIFAQKWFG